MKFAIKCDQILKSDFATKNFKCILCKHIFFTIFFIFTENTLVKA